MPKKQNSRLSFGVPSTLRRALEESAKRNDRTLSEEVQTRLALTFDLQAMSTGTDGDELLLLRLDRGLIAWLRAYSRGWSLVGGLQATAVWAIRSYILDAIKPDHIYGACVKFLPDSIRVHVEKTPKYQAILSGHGGVSIYRDK